MEMIHLLSPSRTAVLIIDVQQQFCTTTNWGAELPGKISSYVKSISKKPVKFIYTKSVGDPGRVPQNVQRFREVRGIAAGVLSLEPAAELCPMYFPPERLILEKPCFDAFAYTSLGEHLRERGVFNVLVGGVMTDVCVEATARRAVMEGYDTYILKDLIAAPEDHSLNVTRVLEFFENYYGYVVRSSDVRWAMAD